MQKISIITNSDVMPTIDYVNGYATVYVLNVGHGLHYTAKQSDTQWVHY